MTPSHLVMSLKIQQKLKVKTMGWIKQYEGEEWAHYDMGKGSWHYSQTKATNNILLRPDSYKSVHKNNQYKV